MEAVREERALLSNKELADGTAYENPLQTGWTPPKWIVRKGQSYIDAIRKNKGKLLSIWNILSKSYE